MASCCVTLCNIVWCLLMLCVGSTIQHPAVRDKRAARMYTDSGYVPTYHRAWQSNVQTTPGVGHAQEFTQNPANAAKFNNQEMQLTYLSQYGYITDSSKQEISNIMSHGGSTPSALTAAIRQFQAMMSIPQTGVMDAKTKETMASPRCGNKDNLHTAKRRRKRYAAYGSPWETDVITWKIVAYSRQMDYQTQSETITKAFQQWSDVTPLRFVQDQSESKANIEIKWVKKDHFDGHPFDGPSGVLAHAKFPSYLSFNSWVHFDEDEYWTLQNAASGINLLWVARHEIGHALGLAHSENEWATMRATYFPFDISRNNLGSDDIKGIRSIYGQIRKDHYCSIGKMAAILTIRTETYLILNAFILSADSNQINPTHYAVTERFANTVNNLVDAVFHYGTNIYLFQGNTVYVYDKYFKYVTKKSLSEVLTFGINYVSAAFEHNNRAYIVAGRKVYEVQPQSSNHIFIWRGTTDLTNDWGVPSLCQVTAATTWINGILYFFCEHYYYEDPRLQQDASYPRSTAEYWWGCSRTADLGATGSPLTGQNLILENISKPRAEAAASEASVSSIHPALGVLLILQTVYQSSL